MTWKYTRVRPETIGALRHPETGSYVTPDPRQPYRSDDPLVAAYPDNFVTDEDLATEVQAAQTDDNAPVERATRAPGERRQTRRG